jgi:hypothetical protein
LRHIPILFIAPSAAPGHGPLSHTRGVNERIVRPGMKRYWALREGGHHPVRVMQVCSARISVSSEEARRVTDNAVEVFVATFNDEEQAAAALADFWAAERAGAIDLIDGRRGAPG